MNAPQQKENSGANAEAKIEGAGLFIAVAALAVSFLSVGLWVATMVFAPQIVEAKIKEGAARAEAMAELARKEASTAKDMVDLEKSKAQAYQDLTKELKNAQRR